MLTRRMVGRSMAKLDKISHFLPIRFANGTKVRRFAKHCPKCRTIIEADAMLGIAHLINNRIFIIAQACCPHCQLRFSIKCMVNSRRRVRSVLLPDRLLSFCLKLCVRNLPQPLPKPPLWPFHEASHLRADSGKVLAENEAITYSDELLGQFDGTKIFSWIEFQGQRYVFERAAPPGNPLPLSAGQVLLSGKLIYQMTEDRGQKTEGRSGHHAGA